MTLTLRIVSIHQPFFYPACVGVLLGPLESTKQAGPDNPLLVAAVGNGEMCVVDRGGGDIQPRDYLISSDVRGCAMKDDPARFPIGHIIASRRAAHGLVACGAGRSRPAHNENIDLVRQFRPRTN